MKTILNQYLTQPLFDACVTLLNHLHIQINEVSRRSISFEDLYQQPLTKALQGVMSKVAETYFLGTVDEASLSGHSEGQDAETITVAASEGRYIGMMFFAVDVLADQHLTRGECAVLTRGFNRIASAQPVVLFIKHGKFLSVATCERSEYTQQWRDGEKLGKVCILRDINCEHPHRGHCDNLELLGDKSYPTFEELYKHWIEVFSSELLTRKFYAELSDWYAWAVKVVHFPNDLATEADNQKYNAEAMIRLITRLIFVWFLKQRHLIPEEFFDEEYIADNLIKGFTPTARSNLFGKSEDSHYYKGVLQNLFFAMLNSPITTEGKDTVSERRFRNGRGDYDNNKLMRYEDLFINPDLFVELANRHVPFLNGGLFDCLDDKDNGVYIDAFTDREAISKQLIVPDYLFFGEDVGRNIDLSEWYGDAKKKKVSARGIIDILKRYNFTIEENTPLEQEVSLDPELLGKVFENLLASYNPETQTTARKQTGSFYTPREIVQYMVDESLIARLKRTVGEELEPEFRKLLQYNEIEPNLTADQKKQVMKSLYECKVLNPACGSGAFPMGMLQQMVHVLNRIDPDNVQWKEMMLDNAISETSEVYRNATNEERAEMVADIERSFNESINRPDYARKLYLIENCIYGIDIQPIAIQISKLRFFISLVVDQKTNDNPVDNFGIRPLPNLEAKFVAANTLIGLEKKEANLFDTDAILQKEKELKEAKHKIFGAKTVKTKRKYKERVAALRTEIAEMLEESGSIGNQEAQQLASWDMFDQHTSSPFFDPEWMFGVSDGFDVVIGNPPYIDSETMEKTMPELRQLYRTFFSTARGNWDMFVIFVEKGLVLLKQDGVLTMIIPNKLIAAKYANELRSFIQNRSLQSLRDYSRVRVFEAFVYPCVVVISNSYIDTPVVFQTMRELNGIESSHAISRRLFNRDLLWDKYFIDDKRLGIMLKLCNNQTLSNMTKEVYGAATVSEAYDIKSLLVEKNSLQGQCLKFVNTGTLDPYTSLWGYKNTQYIKGVYSCPVVSEDELRRYSYRRYCQAKAPKVIVAGMSNRLEAYYDDGEYLAGKSTSIIIGDIELLKCIVSIVNSSLMSFWLRINFNSLKMSGGYINVGVNEISSIPMANITDEKSLVALVDCILAAKKENPLVDTSELENKIDFLVYKLYGLSYDEVLVVDPETTITCEEYEKNK